MSVKSGPLREACQALDDSVSLLQSRRVGSCEKILNSTAALETAVHGAVAAFVREARHRFCQRDNVYEKRFEELEDVHKAAAAHVRLALAMIEAGEQEQWWEEDVMASLANVLLTLEGEIESVWPTSHITQAGTSLDPVLSSLTGAHYVQSCVSASASRLTGPGAKSFAETRLTIGDLMGGGGGGGGGEVWNEVAVVVRDSGGGLMRGLRAQDVHSISVCAESGPGADKGAALPAHAVSLDESSAALRFMYAVPRELRAQKVTTKVCIAGVELPTACATRPFEGRQDGWPFQAAVEIPRKELYPVEIAVSEDDSFVVMWNRFNLKPYSLDPGHQPDVVPLPNRFWESLGVAEGKDLGLEGVAFNSDGNVLLVQRSVDPTSYTCTIVECTVTGDFVRCVLPLGQIVRPAASRVIKFAATSLTAAVCILLHTFPVRGPVPSVFQFTSGGDELFIDWDIYTLEGTRRPGPIAPLPFRGTSSLSVESGEPRLSLNLVDFGITPLVWSPSGDHLIVSLDEGLEGERYDDGWWSFTVDKTSVAALREGCDMVTQGAPYPQILHELHGSGSIAYNSDLGQRVSAVAVSGGCVYVLLEKICLPWHNSSGEPSEIPQLLKFK